MLRRVLLLQRAVVSTQLRRPMSSSSSSSSTGKDGKAERSVAAQLYEDIFKDTASSKTTTTTTTTTDAPDTSAAPVSNETKAQIWRDLFANRLLSKPDAKYLLHPDQQQQQPDTFLREDTSAARVAAFKLRTFEFWEKLLSTGEPSTKSVDRVQQLLDESVVGSFTPEATTLFSRYPRTVKSWLVNAFRPRGIYNDEGEWVPGSPYPQGGYVSYINQAAEAAGRPQDKISANDVLPMLPTNDVLLNQTVRGSEELGRSKIKHVFMPPKRRDKLPADLEGKYMFGLTEDEVADLSPKLKEVLSFRYSTQMDINHFRIQQAIGKWKRFEYDSGSTPAQVAALSERIRYLTEHSKTHKKDKHSMRGLISLVARRRKLLRYLKRKDIPAYFQLRKEYNIRESE